MVRVRSLIQTSEARRWTTSPTKIPGASASSDVARVRGCLCERTGPDGQGLLNADHDVLAQSHEVQQELRVTLLTAFCMRCHERS